MNVVTDWTNARAKKFPALFRSTHTLPADVQMPHRHRGAGLAASEWLAAVVRLLAAGVELALLCFLAHSESAPLENQQR